MKKFYYYKIAGLNVRIAGEQTAARIAELNGFAAFETVATAEVDIDVAVDCSDVSRVGEVLSRFCVDGAEHVFSADGERYCFELTNEDGESSVLNHVKESNLVRMSSCSDQFMLRFMMWTAYSLVALDHGVMPIHASTICYEEQTMLFLGESGTGKSTHSRMWLENVGGANLLNDDSPLVRMKDGSLYTYGSPWSGKTPCYKNEYYPTKAFVRIKRGPVNEVAKHGALAALAALYPSCPPMYATDDVLSDKMLAIVSDVIKTTPVYTLTCLPNADAAHTVREELYGRD